MRYRIPLFSLLVTALLASAPAGAQGLEDYDYENLAFRGVGLDFGTIWPRRVERTVVLGARADLGFLGPNVRVAPGITFWSSRLRQGEVDELRRNVLTLCREPGADCVRELGEVRVSDLALNLDALYTWSDYLPEPYAGAGVAIHLLNGQGELIDDTFVEDLLDAIAPGLNLVAGVELPLGPQLRLFGEGRAALAADVQYLGVNLGGRWAMPLPAPGRAR